MLMWNFTISVEETFVPFHKKVPCYLYIKYLLVSTSKEWRATPVERLFFASIFLVINNASKRDIFVFSFASSKTFDTPF